MVKYSGLVVLIILIIGCDLESSYEPPSNRAFKNLAHMAYNGSFYGLSDTLKLLISKNQTIVLSTKPFPEKSYQFAFQCIEKNRAPLKVEIPDSIYNIKGNGNIYCVNYNKGFGSCKGLKLGYGQTTNDMEFIWELRFENEDLYKLNTGKGVDYLKEHGVDVSQVYWELLKEKGIFFQAYPNCYLWYYAENLYVISKRKKNNLRFMLHVLNDGHIFKNMDFKLENKATSDLAFIKKYTVAKVPFPSKYLRNKIRIGVYVKSKEGNMNLWAKEVDMALVLENELLRYDNEFE